MSNSENIKKILSMSDGEIKDKILQAASLSGADGAKILAAAGDIGRLKRTISGLSDADIERLISKLDNENLKSLLESLGGR